MSEEKRLMKGNEAIAEAAIRSGCRAYFGYPITPQNELTAYMARHMIDRGRVFIQAESEVAAINMVYGAASTGARAMTSSSSPGVSLKQEGISYAAGADVPLVLANVVRGGPGLGSIAPAQSDYFQSTRGGGHGDYYTIVLAPKSVQEAADLTYLAFDLADKWRIPVIIQADEAKGIASCSKERVASDRRTIYRTLSVVTTRWRCILSECEVLDDLAGLNGDLHAVCGRCIS